MQDWRFVILHVDLDSFFASVHIKNYPFLQGYPIIIGSDPRGGDGRGVASTCSYEARAYGLHSGIPISKAYNLCPHGIYICSGKQVNFSTYNEESSKVMTILKEYTDKFQSAGIDEAYLDVTQGWRNYGSSPRAIAEVIQKRIKSELKLPVSIGVAETKSIAKIASDLNKPNGITVINNADLEIQIYHLPVRKIVGVGKKTEAHLNQKGIENIGDIARMSRERIFLLLGEYGLYLRKVVLGLNFREVGYFKGERKSISSERTFGIDQNDWQVVYSMVSDIVSKLAKRLSENDLLTRTISIKIRFQGYETFTRCYSFKNYVSDKDVIYETALKLLEEFQSYSKKVRLVGVRVSSLKSNQGQLSLLPFINC